MRDLMGIICNNDIQLIQILQQLLSRQKVIKARKEKMDQFVPKFADLAN